jgi:hypothetical protein
MFRCVQAVGTLRAEPRQVLPDGRPDAGPAALRAVFGFARCSPRSRRSHSSQMSLRCSFAFLLSLFDRFLPRNPRFRRILRIAKVWWRSQSESPSHVQQPWGGDSDHKGRKPETVYTVSGLSALFSRTWKNVWGGKSLDGFSSLPLRGAEIHASRNGRAENGMLADDPTQTPEQGIWYIPSMDFPLCFVGLEKCAGGGHSNGGRRFAHRSQSLPA